MVDRSVYVMYFKSFAMITWLHLFFWKILGVEKYERNEEEKRRKRVSG